MKIANVMSREKATYGFVVGNEILLSSALKDLMKRPLPETVEEFIADDDMIRYVRSNLTEAYSKAERSHRLPLSEAKLLAPLTNPPKILCLGLNYLDHAEEQGSPVSEEPVLFMKPRTAINGPFSDVVKPNWVQQVDYECELAVVIGKKGKYVRESEAYSYVFGYMVFNDVSARDIQFKDRQWTRGKSFDGFAPIGPWITSIDEVADPHLLEMKTLVNREVRQNSSTSKMHLKIPQIVSQLSRVMTLEPGDIIATGTPAGVGRWMKPTPKFLKHGDVVELSISKLGSLRNRIVEQG